MIAWGESETTEVYRALSLSDAVRALLPGCENDPEAVDAVNLDPDDFPPLPPHAYEDCLHAEVMRLCGD